MIGIEDVALDGYKLASLEHRWDIDTRLRGLDTKKYTRGEL